jgi:hypothetical protein
MTEDEVNKLKQRIDWLERKMVRVLWLLVSVTSGAFAFVVASSFKSYLGWASLLLGFGLWIALGLILQRQEFKGAPGHIEFIDP